MWVGSGVAPYYTRPNSADKITNTYCTGTDCTFLDFITSRIKSTTKISPVSTLHHLQEEIKAEHTTAFAQHPPSSISTCATTLAALPLLAKLQTSTNPVALSVKATNLSLNSLGATEFAVPPLLVVASRKSCAVMLPFEARLKAEM
jgi:hypothetical protein